VSVYCCLGLLRVSKQQLCPDFSLGLLLAQEGRSRGARFNNQCFHILRKEDMGERRACPSEHEKNAGWVVVSNKYPLRDVCLYLNNIIALEKFISVQFKVGGYARVCMVTVVNH